MAHTGSCAGAKTSPSKCRCSCRSDYHGSAFRLAFILTPCSEDDDRMVQVDAGKSPKGRKKKGEKESQSVAADMMSEELADWLTTGNKAVGDHLENVISNTLVEKITSQLDKSVGRPRRKKLEKSLSRHFLCSLLAALACAADKVDGIPERASSAIGRSLREKGNSRIDGLAIKVAVQTAWSEISKILQQHALILHPGGHPVLLARALGYLTCPAPKEHPEVENCCVNPLRDVAVKDVTKQLLVNVLPGWLGGT